MADRCVNDAFWQLLRAGIWQSDDELAGFPKLTVDQWRQVIETARLTQLDGIIYDGITRLDDDRRPSKDVENGIFRRATQLVSHHFHHKKIIATITGILEDAGIESVVLKGLRVAECYPTPTRRNCGDIDIYVGPEKFDLALETLIAKGITREDAIKKSPIHYEFEYSGVPIELHYHAIGDAYGAKEQEIRDWEEDALLGRKGGEEEDRVFMAFFLFQHAYHHLITGDARLRQFVDLARYLHVNHGKIDTEKLRARLEQFNMLKVWKKVGCFVTGYLGLPTDRMPLYDAHFEKYGHQLFAFQSRYCTVSHSDILPASMSHGTWRSAIYTYNARIKMYRTINSIFPRSANPQIAHLTKFALGYLTKLIRK